MVKFAPTQEEFLLIKGCIKHLDYATMYMQCSGFCVLSVFLQWNLKPKHATECPYVEVTANLRHLSPWGVNGVCFNGRTTFLAYKRRAAQFWETVHRCSRSTESGQKMNYRRLLWLLHLWTTINKSCPFNIINNNNYLYLYYSDLQINADTGLNVYLCCNMQYLL